MLNIAAIAMIAGFFLVLMTGPDPTEHAGLGFRSMVQADPATTSAEALARLANQPLAKSRATKGERRAIWLLAPVTDPTHSDLLLFGDKQIATLEVWTVLPSGDIRWGGAYVRDRSPEGPFRRTANVVAFQFDRAGTHGQPIAILARVTMRASATITVGQTGTNDFARYEASQERIAATLAASLGLLALFFTLVAQFSSTPLFRTFAFWLISSVAFCAALYEYDYLWFGQWAGSGVELHVKLLVVALYSLTTAQLFMHLFRRGLARVRMLRTMKRFIVANTVVAALSFVVPVQYFQPVFWLFVVSLIAVSSTAVARITRTTTASTPGWYAAGWGAQLLAGLAEVCYAAGLIARHDWLSFQTSVLVSALITGLAVADTLRVERSRRHAARRAAARSAARYRMIYDTVAVGMATVSADGLIVQANRELVAELPELAQVPDGKKIPLASVIGADRAMYLRHPDPGVVRSVQWEYTTPAGERHVYSIKAAPDARGPDAGIEITFTDITANAKLNETLEHLASHDSLTGLLNRRGLEAEFEGLRQQSLNGAPACVAYVDMDRFKLINEFYGHAVGDAILKQASERIAICCPPKSSLGRVGGDEFVILLQNLDGLTARAAITGLLERLLVQPYAVDGKELSVSASAGIVEFEASMSMSDAIAFADRACMAAKSKGKGMVIAYSNGDAVLDEYRDHMLLGTAIRSHFPFDRLRIYSQPIVSLDPTSTRPCYEVLLRVSDETGSSVMQPGRLIEIAEQQGMMADLDRFVLRRTLEHMSEHLSSTRRTRFVTINLSGQSVNDDRFVADVISLLREHESIARHVMLEFTESVALRDIESTRKFVDQIRAFGARAALDDFGAGYTSFNYLKSFPANVVKIDGSFIRDLNRHPANFAITRAITALCHELKIQVIAEWVEDIPTLLGLLELEADFAQGYVFSPAKPIEHWIDNAVDTSPLLEAHASFLRQAPFRRFSEPFPREQP